MKLYYQDDFVVIYHGNSIESFCELPSYDLVITDPPYGVSHPTRYLDRGRSKLTKCNNYAPVYADNTPFDPALWVNKPCCLWGANHYADKLTPSSGWLVWDKERPDTLDQATCELAWTNFVKGVRRFRFLWDGCRRSSHEPLIHPTQKPIALFTWIYSLRWTPQGTILDPFMGSGSSLIAAKQIGRKAIGIEIHEPYCEAAAKALEQETPSLFTQSNEEEYVTDTLFRLDCGKVGGGL